MNISKILLIGAGASVAFWACSNASSSAKADESGAADVSSVVQKLFENERLIDSVAHYLDEKDSSVISIPASNAVSAAAYFVDLVGATEDVTYGDSSIQVVLANGDSECKVLFEIEKTGSVVANANFEDCKGLTFSKINFVDVKNWPQNGFFNAVACLDSSSTQFKAFEEDVEACVATLKPWNSSKSGNTDGGLDSDSSIDLSFYGLVGLGETGYGIEGNEFRTCKENITDSTTMIYIFQGSKNIEMDFSLSMIKDSTYAFTAFVMPLSSADNDDANTAKKNFENLMANADSVFNWYVGMHYIFYLDDSDTALVNAIKNKLNSGCSMAKKSGASKEYCIASNIEENSMYYFALYNDEGLVSTFFMSKEDDQFVSVEGTIYSADEFSEKCEIAQSEKIEGQTVSCVKEMNLVQIETIESDMTDESFAKRQTLYNEACNTINETGSSESALNKLSGVSK